MTTDVIADSNGIPVIAKSVAIQRCTTPLPPSVKTDGNGKNWAKALRDAVRVM
ncbi:MAG: hypothetical protein LBF85_02590 [Tannerella sp.]|jgi:hypothetical protein|nr:hypothetical protein [Tannerella sp.]